MSETASGGSATAGSGRQARQGEADPRRRMIEEMQLRRFSDRTIESYVRSVGPLAGWCWKAPHEVTDEELRDYFLYLKNQKRLARATTTIALCAIKFFFETTPKRDPRCLSAVSRWPRTPVS